MRLMSSTWPIMRCMRLLDDWMRLPSMPLLPAPALVPVPVSVRSSTMPAMLIEFSGSRRSWPSIASNCARVASVCARREFDTRTSSPSIMRACVRMPSSHGWAQPRTVSCHASNEPRGVRRSPRRPARLFSGLPPQATCSICSVRSSTHQPPLGGSNGRPSMPAHLPRRGWTSSGHSLTQVRASTSCASGGSDATIASPSAWSMPRQTTRPYCATTSACACVDSSRPSPCCTRASSGSSSSSSDSTRLVRTLAACSTSAASARDSRLCTVAAITCASTSAAMRTE